MADKKSGALLPVRVGCGQSAKTTDLDSIASGIARLHGVLWRHFHLLWEDAGYTLHMFGHNLDRVLYGGNNDIENDF